MPVTVSYPGVYIDEVPGGSRAIAGVPTSVAAFVGYSLRGPTDEAVHIFSFADFERTFGELHPASKLSYAVNHFFLNGGATAWIVRVAEDAATASVTLGSSGVPTLRVDAASEGGHGNNLRLVVDYNTSSPGSTFNLTVEELREISGRLVTARTETHRNLSMSATSANYAVVTVNKESRLVTLTDLGAPVGTARVTGAPISSADVAALGDTRRRIAVTIDGTPRPEFDLFDLGNNAAVNTDELARAEIETQVQNLLGNGDFTMSLIDGRLVAELTDNGSDRSIRFRRASTNSGTAALGLTVGSGAREEESAAAARPTASGTVGGRLPDFDGSEVTAGDQLVVEVRDAADTVVDMSTTVTFADAPTTLAAARRELETQLRASSHPAVASASVTVWDDRLVVRSGSATPSTQLAFTGDAANDLALADASPDASRNLSVYQVGVGPIGGAQTAVAAGRDGNEPTDLGLYTGDQGAKTGFYALEDADLFNILNIPDISDIGVLSEAVTYAEERRSMLIVDIDDGIASIDDARDWVNAAENSSLKHRNVVAYFPRVRLADPLMGGRVRTFPNGAVMAGLWARTDAQRGVWKAPAGIEARLRGVQALDYVMTDPENGVLNPLGLNCLRTFPVFGTVSWGARTLVGADAFASEWKYVPVRRLALFIEESLYRGTQFVVFEPNDEPLWAQIRLSVGSFMQQLFRQGALQGSTPQEAYLVRCDSSTTTQADIDLGIVNILVGFAPLKPAEFVIIQIQQLAGQGQS